MADISKITLPNGETYNIDAVTVEGHTVKTNVPTGAVFTDTKDLNSMTGTLPVSKGGTGGGNAETARTNLGLGVVATKDVDATITENSSSTNIPTTAAVVNFIKNREVEITVDSTLSSSSTNPVQNKVIYSAMQGKADTSSLATVATSGSYNDLSNKPTIPSISGLQTQAITDAGGYFSTDTVEAALQQLGAAVDGVETLLAAI